MRGRTIVAGVLILVGLVWIGQGLGVLRGGSFMVDDIRWAIAGIGMLIAGGLVGLSAMRSRPGA